MAGWLFVADVAVSTWYLFCLSANRQKKIEDLVLFVHPISSMSMAMAIGGQEMAMA